MADRIFPKSWTCLLAVALLSACASKAPAPVESPDNAAAPPHTPEQLRINELERLLAEKQRQCLDDRRRQDALLKESQKKTDELQKKIDALLAIDRELRRSKAR
jgi:small-conductance mechanosensitive channel